MQYTASARDSMEHHLERRIGLREPGDSRSHFKFIDVHFQGVRSNMSNLTHSPDFPNHSRSVCADFEDD